MSQDKVDKAAKNLLRIQKKVCNNNPANVPTPSFMAVITGMGEVAYQRSDGIYVIPFRTLGA